MAIPFWKMRFQSLDGVPPLGCAGLADGVLVAKESHFIDRLVDRNGVKPLHFDEILGLFRVAGVLLIKVGVL